MNEREVLKEKLRDYTERITAKSKGGMYVCPLCGSGTGRNHTGAFSIASDGKSWTCFSCGEKGDLFDLIGKVENIPDFNEQLKRAGEIYGYQIKNEQYTHKSSSITDYSKLYADAHKNINKTNYHRGLSQEILNRFSIGYIETWRHPEAKNAPLTPRLIIPTSKESYIARDTREEIPEAERDYKKMKVGKVHIFNAEALKTATKPIYIVEGEIDALSIIEVGGEAVGLGSANMAGRLLELLKKNKPVQPLVIALDNDEEGTPGYKNVQKFVRQLEEGLTELEIPFYRLNPAMQYKDANEALIKDREAFALAVAKAETIKEDLEAQRKEEYFKSSVANHIQDFIQGIADSVNTPYIPTGFTNLDKELDGGLYEGLYIIGAMSTLGKTTFILQIIDQIAEAGSDCLLFSLEMSRTELMSKSISRHTFLRTLGGNTRNAKSARGITTGKRYEHYSKEETDLIQTAITDYSKYAEHIFIHEGIGNIGAEDIRETVKEHIYFTGRTPVIFVDYLQILEPHNERATDKQNIDRAVVELKRLSRDYKAPVICISSFNRNNYKAKALMEAFKESGSIEYSSDTLIGLQIEGAGTKDFDYTETLRTSSDYRNIELVILKNRNGRVGEIIPYEYYPIFNFFKEK